MDNLSDSSALASARTRPVVASVDSASLVPYRSRAAKDSLVSAARARNAAGSAVV